GNTLRFPRARDEPPHSQRTLAVGSHRLRFPAGVFVYFLRWLCALQHHQVYCLVKQCLFTFVLVDWSGGQSTPAGSRFSSVEAEALPAKSDCPERKSTCSYFAAYINYED